MPEKVLIAMSGGVDSSAAAVLMQRQGFDCIGATMKLYEREGSCGSSADAEDARRVCEKLAIPHHVLDETERFSRCVIDGFIRSYEEGETPNPCIRCNREMKFGVLYRQALQWGCSKLVTGHYARVCYDPRQGRYRLYKAQNVAKDQSYFLYFLSPEQLAHIAFPLGDMSEKEEIRQIAEQAGLVTARKRDSQDICFVENGRYADFIARRTGKTYAPGPFRRLDGTVMGEHRGIIGYTVGQRKGLGLSLPAPLYVCRKTVEDNTVWLGQESDLYTDTLLAGDCCWTAGQAPDEPIRVEAKTRYSAAQSAATVTPLADGRMRVVFDEPQRAVTQGQAVVLYRENEVLGGGTIQVTEIGKDGL